MTFRNYFHIYQILEEYSKDYISFEYTPEYILDKGYPLSKLDIDDVLKNNGLLIKALYDKNEKTINSILLNKPLPPTGNYTFAQLGEEDAIALNKDSNLMMSGLPLPIQARYVLSAWNALRIGNNNEITRLTNLLKQEAFKGSLYTQITLMALSFNCDCFNDIAIKAYSTLTRPDTYYLYYKLLAYYFRLKENTEGINKSNKENNKELKTVCNSLSKNYKNNKPINKDNEESILRNLQ